MHETVPRNKLAYLFVCDRGAGTDISGDPDTSIVMGGGGSLRNSPPIQNRHTPSLKGGI